jgi:hypothetical protein
MTEEKWLTRNDPDTLLQFVGPRASSRKLRLFACACCRRIWDLLTDPVHRHAVETSERYADRLATRAELKEARANAWKCGSRVHVGPARAAAPRGMLREASLAADEIRGVLYARACAGLVPEDQVQAGHTADTSERAAQSALLRDVIGNPFRVAEVDPAWLRWQQGTVVRIAQTIYEQRRFADLPILADALEEAGCTDAAILAHCRQGGEHVPGCWVVDLLLQKD